MSEYQREVARQSGRQRAVTAPRKGGKFARPDEPPPPKTIIELIDQCYPEFQAESWSAWRAFLKALFGLEMTDADQVLFRQFTKRDTISTAAFDEAWLVVAYLACRSAADSRVSGPRLTP